MAKGKKEKYATLFNNIGYVLLKDDEDITIWSQDENGVDSQIAFEHESRNILKQEFWENGDRFEVGYLTKGEIIAMYEFIKARWEDEHI